MMRELIRVRTEAREVLVDITPQVRQVALPRQIAMYLLRKEAHISLPQIGEQLGGRDHTTVMHGCDKINNLLEHDEQLRRRVALVRERIQK